jgi:hypothetical protein
MDKKYVIEWTICGWTPIEASNEDEAEEKLDSMQVSEIIEKSEAQINNFSVSQKVITEEER